MANPGSLRKNTQSSTIDNKDNKYKYKKRYVESLPMNLNTPHERESLLGSLFGVSNTILLY